MRLSERLKTKALPSNYLAPQRGFAYQLLNGRIVGYSDKKITYVDKGYMMNDNVYSVINVILDKVRIPEWSTYKVVDEQALKQYKALTMRKDLYGRDYTKALDLRLKALEPVEDPKLKELLDWPNEDECWNDFFTNGVGFKMLTGDKFVHASILGAGANSGLPQELRNLPSQNISIIASNSWPVRELGYTLMQWQLQWGRETVLHEKYWNPTWSTSGDELYGMSPLKALLQTLCRDNANALAGASAFTNMGIAGVLYVDDTRFEADQGLEQANAVKEVIQGAEYSGPETTGKIATSGYKLGWQALGLSPVDLNLIEAAKLDLRKICNAYGVPSQVMNDPENKSYNNSKEGEAALTSRCAMPQLISGRASFNRKLQTDWGYKGKNIIIDFDPACFTELRQSAKEVAEWTQMVEGLTINEQRDLVGMDARPEAEADELRIKMGRQSVSELQANVVDDELGADTE